MTNESFQGWSNRATWNASLWLSNDYGSYRTVDCLADSFGDDFAGMAREIFDYAVESWGTKTPDGESLAEVNWLEIATDWRR